MNVEIGTESPIFLFWEYLFRKLGILSLQCIESPSNREDYTFTGAVDRFQSLILLLLFIHTYLIFSIICNLIVTVFSVGLFLRYFASNGLAKLSTTHPFLHEG
jgi:hypothetical protein